MVEQDDSPPWIKIPVNQTGPPLPKRLLSFTATWMCTPKRSWRSLRTLRGPPDICTHFALPSCDITCRVKLSSALGTTSRVLKPLCFFPSGEINSHRKHGFACFLSPENDPPRPKLENSCFTRQPISLVPTSRPVNELEYQVHATRNSEFQT